MSEKIKYMDIAEFRKLGYLQEANRLFFHPHGLALDVQVDEDGTECLNGIWDYRDDPEGMCFGEGMISYQKALTVATEMVKHSEMRKELFGDIIQHPDAE